MFSKIFFFSPSFFHILIYEKIFKILESGGQNKNEKKIPKIVQSIKNTHKKTTTVFLFLEVTFSVLNWLLKDCARQYLLVGFQ